MNDQSQDGTSCCSPIYTVMPAPAAETHRSARPAAAAQRLRFPGDHNEQAAVLRAAGKCLAQGSRCPNLGTWVAACLLTSVPPQRTDPNLSPESLRVSLEQETSSKLTMLLGRPFTLESSCWVMEKREELQTSRVPMTFIHFHLK